MPGTKTVELAGLDADTAIAVVESHESRASLLQIVRAALVRYQRVCSVGYESVQVEAFLKTMPEIRRRPESVGYGIRFVVIWTRRIVMQPEPVRVFGALLNTRRLENNR